jgi:hypothetical protein
VDHRALPTGTAILTGFAMMLAATSVSGDRGTLQRAADGSATIADCTGAAARDVHLGDPTRVDRFVVDLGRQASSGVTRVRVRAGGFERVLHVTGAGARGLRFHPALEAETFTVTVEPLDSEPGACLERVTLFEGSTRVAVVER